MNTSDVRIQFMQAGLGFIPDKLGSPSFAEWDILCLFLQTAWRRTCEQVVIVGGAQSRLATKAGSYRGQDAGSNRGRQRLPAADEFH